MMSMEGANTKSIRGVNMKSSISFVVSSRD